MSARVVLRPNAESDLSEARDWYEMRREGLGQEFVEAVHDVLTLLSQAPELFPIALRNVRRTKIRRFPYVVYYRNLDDCIEVIAVLHGSRSPKIWRGRI